ncbi:hypothetical protein IFM89_029322 [Coptis chinensis]|uniref:DNA repair RAD52-like protein 2, chloroplastic n=1 Tax=Coptis chinensis TaxID=261450 RepID=A0A835IS69_9MAGN|nr:hypothetical protein IFM89_029322 [Coptis chinensis]
MALLNVKGVFQLSLHISTKMNTNNTNIIIKMSPKKTRMASLVSGVLPNSNSSTNYVVPLDNSSCITRPLAEILRDLNKRVPDNIIKPDANFCIPWYHANRMLSFYAPVTLSVGYPSLADKLREVVRSLSGVSILECWCGEIRDVIFSENGSVTVVYRVTIRGSDGEAHRESTGTVSSSDIHIEDPVSAAEEIAFSRACARFGLGLYLYHEDGAE